MILAATFAGAAGRGDGAGADAGGGLAGAAAVALAGAGEIEGTGATEAVGTTVGATVGMGTAVGAGTVGEGATAGAVELVELDTLGLLMDATGAAAPPQAASARPAPSTPTLRRAVIPVGNIKIDSLSG